MRSIIAIFLFSSLCFATRIKDLAALRGSRDNQLLGYGLVIGLAGTGDKSLELTENSLDLALKKIGADTKAKKMETKNVAAVVVSATLPPFAKGGNRIDVTVSSIGSATSLEEGTLVATSLRGPDGKTYAVAQGKVSVPKKADSGQRSGGRAGGAQAVTGLVLNGGLVEKEIAFDLASKKDLVYNLQDPDFTTAARMVLRINEELGGKYAVAEDAATVNVIVPYQFDGTAVDLVARIESIDIEADRKAKVVVNAKTGTVILGEYVQIAPVAIAHNNLKIEIKQKGEKKEGEEEAEVTTITKKVLPLPASANIADIAASLNEIGASAEDLVSLLHSLKASGALMAELEFK